MAEIESKYYNLNHPHAYTGSAKRIAEMGPNAKEWLQNQPTYTLHKPVKRKFSTRAYKTSVPDHQWQADLVDMQKFKKQNRGYAYILTAIDIFTRYAFGIPIKTKAFPDVINGFTVMFKQGRKPNLLQTDQGKEFENKHIQTFFKKHGIRQFSVMSPYKAAIVERFHRTLRGRMFRYFTKKGTRKWYDVLHYFVTGYNNTKHSSLFGYAPASINTRNAMLLWEKQNPNNLKSLKKPVFKVGDLVRLAKVKKTFDHGYTENWTDQIFKISALDTRTQPIMYVVDELDTNERVQGKFYKEELQKVSNVFRIEKILKSHIRKGQLHHYVKWVGYDKPSWIESTAII